MLNRNTLKEPVIRGQFYRRLDRGFIPRSSSASALGFLLHRLLLPPNSVTTQSFAIMQRVTETWHLTNCSLTYSMCEVTGIVPTNSLSYQNLNTRQIHICNILSAVGWQVFFFAFEGANEDKQVLLVHLYKIYYCITSDQEPLCFFCFFYTSSYSKNLNLTNVFRQFLLPLFPYMCIHYNSGNP